jgi:hypothetical protein
MEREEEKETDSLLLRFPANHKSIPDTKTTENANQHGPVAI